METTAPLMIENDAIVLGILLLILALIFKAETSEHPVLRKFFTYVPGLLFCYFIPAVLSSLGIVDGDSSKLYFVASRYLLPSCLVLLTLSIDLRGILRLGNKSIIMFLTGTVGIMVGGPIAVLLTRPLFPALFEGGGENATWLGMTTVAGSWIGGGANQTAMKEVFEVGDGIFSSMIAVDILCANAWMAILLVMAANAKRIDAWVGADASAIEELRESVEKEQNELSKTPDTAKLMGLLALAFGGTALGHIAGDTIAPAIGEHFPELAKYSLTSPFFWIVVVSTAFGIGLSLTKARAMSGYGASRVGTVFLYILIATIGMKMNIGAVLGKPELFVVGFIWLGVHAVLLLVVGKIIKAPVFFLAVGSQANVGGAASAPVLASAFHPALAPVGVLLAVFGYGIGTYGAYICGQLLRAVAQ